MKDSLLDLVQRDFLNNMMQETLIQKSVLIARV